jgi:hypothetical protein
MLFIYSVYLSLPVKALLVFYFNVGSLLDLYKTPFALLGILFYYTSVVANTLVNTDVLPPRRIILVYFFLAAVATLTASACSSTIAFSKQFCTLFE